MSPKAPGIKDGPRERKVWLIIKVVVEELVKRNNVNIMGDKKGVSSDDIKMLKPF